MKQESLHTLLEDALGMIDDDLIESVDKLRQQRDASPVFSSDSYVSKEELIHSVHDITPVHDLDSLTKKATGFTQKIIRREIFKWSGLAACLCLFVGIGFLWQTKGNTKADLAIDADVHYSDNKASEAEDSSYILDVQDNGSASTSPETLPAAGHVIPSLYLNISDMIIQAMAGTHSWSWEDVNGLICYTEADSIHPLDASHLLPRIHTTESSLHLQFEDIYGTPDHLSIQCWSEDHWNDTTANSVIITPDDDTISLLEGGHIYEITAAWERGTVRYSFYACYTPSHN